MNNFKNTTLIVLSALLMSCGNSKEKSTPQKAYNYEKFPTESYTSSLVNDTLDNDISVEIPTVDSQRLQDSIREWIINQYIATTDEDKWLKRIAKDASIQEIIDTLAVYWCSGFMEYYPEGGTTGLPWMLHSKITVDLDSMGILSLKHAGYINTGGAHPLDFMYGRSFDRETGKHFEWKHVINDRPLLLSINKGLTEYLQYKLIDEELIPIPETTPWFDREGLHFVYQNYECFGYVAGTPEMSIPYKELPNLLTTKGKEWIGFGNLNEKG